MGDDLTERIIGVNNAFYLSHRGHREHRDIN